MKKRLKIDVSREPKGKGLVNCRTLAVRERLMSLVFGRRQKLAILIPGDSVNEITISEKKEVEMNGPEEAGS